MSDGSNLPVHVGHVVSRSQIVLADTHRRMELQWKELTLPETEVYFVSNGKAGTYASMYDLVARESGISFDAPSVDHIEDASVRVTVRCQYYNAHGIPVQDSETYEIDVDKLYRTARLKWEPEVKGFWQGDDGKWHKKTEQAVAKERATKLKEMREQGYLADEIVYDENDVPISITRRLPPDAEAELYKNFLTLRQTKLAKAVTCCHRRLTQRFLAQKHISFDPEDKNWKQHLKLLIPSLVPVLDEAEGRQAVHDLFDDEGLGEVAADTEDLHERPRPGFAADTGGFDPATTPIAFGKFEGKAWGQLPSHYLEHLAEKGRDEETRTWAKIAYDWRQEWKRQQGRDSRDLEGQTHIPGTDPAKTPGQDRSRPPRRQQQPRDRHEYAGAKSSDPPEWMEGNPAPSQPPAAAAQQPPSQLKGVCATCGTTIPRASAEYSVKTYGVELCFDDQQKRKGARAS